MEPTVLTTSESGWSNVSVQVLGRKFIGLLGFELKKDVEKEQLYASGNAPVDIVSGNKKYEGNLKVMKFEVDLMNEAAMIAGYDDITEVPHDLIVITALYKRGNTRARTITMTGVAFTSLSFAMEQGAKKSEVTLPFLAMGMKVQ